MRWRLIGPHRAGRVTAVAGIAGQPNEYYFGTPGGGVWKTTDGGRVWKPIFDDAHVASIGAIAVAPSQPRTIYVGTGEQIRGSGVFKSTDAGATWTNVGLADTHYIAAILVDPVDANLVLAGASGRLVSLRDGNYTDVPLTVTGEGHKRVDVDALYDVDAYRPKLRDVQGKPMFLS